MAILVCGGAQYIGSHINEQFHKEGYETIVFDNLIYGHKEAFKWGKLVVSDLKNVDEIEAVLRILRLMPQFISARRVVA